MNLNSISKNATDTDCLGLQIFDRKQKKIWVFVANSWPVISNASFAIKLMTNWQIRISVDRSEFEYLLTSFRPFLGSSQRSLFVAVSPSSSGPSVSLE